MVGFSSFNTIVFFSSNSILLRNLFNSLKRFFQIRNIFCFFSHLNVFSLYEGFYLFGWKFFLLKSDFFNLELSCNVINNHILSLKNLVNYKISSSIFSLVEILNTEIFLWVLNFFFSDSVLRIFARLDVFLYRLLWNSLKRIHPRRPKTWIYNKYWKFYKGYWRFYVYDPLLGKFSFLSLHSFFSVPFFGFSRYFNVFESLNRVKLYSVYSVRSQYFLDKLFFYLWKKQFGLCFVCYQMFDFSKQVSFKVFPLNSIFKLSGSLLFSKLVLLHSYCFFF